MNLATGWLNQSLRWLISALLQAGRIWSGRIRKEALGLVSMIRLPGLRDLLILFRLNRHLEWETIILHLVLITKIKLMFNLKVGKLLLEEKAGKT